MNSPNPLLMIQKDETGEEAAEEKSEVKKEVECRQNEMTAKPSLLKYKAKQQVIQKNQL